MTRTSALLAGKAQHLLRSTHAALLGAYLSLAALAVVLVAWATHLGDGPFGYMIIIIRYMIVF